MKNIYFVLANSKTLEVRGIESEKQPKNSLPFESHLFLKAVFDQYPNPTCLIEGATEQEIHDFKVRKGLIEE